jgi:hypothetical protein
MVVVLSSHAVSTGLNCHLIVRGLSCIPEGKKRKIRGFSPQVNYTDRAIAAGQRS